jgi:hypothetical protein
MKAILAIAASILTAAYHMLRDGLPYKDLKSDYFDHRARSKIVKLGVQLRRESESRPIKS